MLATSTSMAKKCRRKVRRNVRLEWWCSVENLGLTYYHCRGQRVVRELLSSRRIQPLLRRRWPKQGSKATEPRESCSRCSISWHRAWRSGSGPKRTTIDRLGALACHACHRHSSLSLRSIILVLPLLNICPKPS